MLCSCAATVPAKHMCRFHGHASPTADWRSFVGTGCQCRFESEAARNLSKSVKRYLSASKGRRAPERSPLIWAGVKRRKPEVWVVGTVTRSERIVRVLSVRAGESLNVDSIQLKRILVPNEGMIYDPNTDIRTLTVMVHLSHYTSHEASHAHDRSYGTATGTSPSELVTTQIRCPCPLRSI